jgi:hypothetical protein
MGIVMKDFIQSHDNFFTRCLFMTICMTIGLSYLLGTYYPRYEFIDATHRVNKVTGKSEYYSSNSYDKGWH